MMQDKIYQKVTEYIKQAIANGTMKLGDAIYSENQLCEMLNVSRTSVRRAIREMVECNILESRQGVGTFVKGLNPSKTICLVNHYSRILRYSPIDSYYTSFIYAAEREAGKANHRFQIFSGIVKDEADIGGKMSHLNADGVILDGRFQDYFDDVACFLKYYHHLILLDGNPAQTQLPSVAPNLVPGFTEILNIISPRNGNILFLYNSMAAQRRWALECFRESVKRQENTCVDFCDYTENIPEDILSGVNHAYLIADVLDKLFATKNYKAIICDADRSAMHVIEYLKRQNLSIPEDVAVSGVGNSAYSSMTSPTTTTLRVDTAALAATAVDLLGKQLQGEKIRAKNLLPVQLLRRGSM